MGRSDNDSRGESDEPDSKQAPGSPSKKAAHTPLPFSIDVSCAPSLLQTLSTRSKLLEAVETRRATAVDVVRDVPPGRSLDQGLAGIWDNVRVYADAQRG